MPKSLPKPLRKQREVLYLPVTGHSAVLGTAGSGKATLALYRAAYLSAADMPHSGRTLLFTAPPFPSTVSVSSCILATALLIVT